MKFYSICYFNHLLLFIANLIHWYNRDFLQNCSLISLVSFLSVSVMWIIYNHNQRLKINLIRSFCFSLKQPALKSRKKLSIISFIACAICSYPPSMYSICECNWERERETARDLCMLVSACECINTNTELHSNTRMIFWNACDDQMAQIWVDRSSSVLLELHSCKCLSKKKKRDQDFISLFLSLLYVFFPSVIRSAEMKSSRVNEGERPAAFLRPQIAATYQPLLSLTLKKMAC